MPRGLVVPDPCMTSYSVRPSFHMVVREFGHDEVCDGAHACSFFACQTASRFCSHFLHSARCRPRW